MKNNRNGFIIEEMKTTVTEIGRNNGIAVLKMSDSKTVLVRNYRI